MPEATLQKHLCRSLGCRTAFPVTESACPKCGRVACPAHETWPEGAKRLISLYRLVDEVQGLADAQAQWERLLTNSFHNRNYGDFIARFSCDPAEVYPVLLRAVEAWNAAQRPTDFDVLREIRRGIRIRAALARPA